MIVATGHEHHQETAPQAQPGSRYDARLGMVGGGADGQFGGVVFVVTMAAVSAACVALQVA